MQSTPPPSFYIQYCENGPQGYERWNPNTLRMPRSCEHCKPTLPLTRILHRIPTTQPYVRAPRPALSRTLSLSFSRSPSLSFSLSHRYTLNFPYDQEAPQPTAITLKGFLLFGVLNVKGCYDIMEQTFRAACGIYPTKHLWWTPAWEDICYPPENVDVCVLFLPRIAFV